MHYNTARYHKRMNQMRFLLGGECAKCGAEDALHIHHRDPNDKAFVLSNEFDRPWEELVVELEKCELLCETCHKHEHRAQHGLGMYSHQKCRCAVCKAAWNAKHREYKMKRKAPKA